MTPLPLRLVVWLTGLGLLALSARADVVFDISIIPRRGENFDTAAFRLWLPDHAGPVKGVAVVLDGINVDGRHLGGRAQWQIFAKNNSLALVSCYFKTDDLSPQNIIYKRAEYGSGRALLAGLVELGKSSGHPEMGTVPLLLLGYSAGGQFSYSFAAFCPERVAAFVPNKSGNFLPAPNAAVRAIPGLFITGEKDKIFPHERTREFVLKQRRLGARWCEALEPKFGHNTANANDLALPFFEAVMRSWDRPAAEREGVAYDLDRKKVIPAGVPPKDALNTIWFPEESILAVREHFISTPR
jgi:pimeloyl-ACP methyl ester carboxylesterase